MGVDAITAGIAALGGVSNALKGFVAFAKEAGKHEVLEKLFEAQEFLMEVQSRQFELAEENRSLRETVRRLEESVQLKETVRHFHNAYWHECEGGKLDGPFDMEEWDRENRLVRMASLRRETKDGIELACFIGSSRCIDVPVAFLRDRTNCDPDQIRRTKSRVAVRGHNVR